MLLCAIAQSAEVTPIAVGHTILHANQHWFESIKPEVAATLVKVSLESDEQRLSSIGKVGKRRMHIQPRSETLSTRQKGSKHSKAKLIVLETNTCHEMLHESRILAIWLQLIDVCGVQDRKCCPHQK